MEIGYSGIWSVLDTSPLYGWRGRTDGDGAGRSEVSVSAEVRPEPRSAGYNPVYRLSARLGGERLSVGVSVPSTRDIAVIKAVSAYRRTVDDGTGLRVRLADFFANVIEETVDYVPPGPVTPLTHEDLTEFGLVVGDRLLLAALETGIADYRDRAKAVLSDYAGENAEVATVSDRLGLIAYLEGDIGTALSYYRTASSQSASNLSYQLSLGWLYLENGEASTAEYHFRQVLKSDPNNAVALALLGVSRGRAGDSEGAVAYFEKALGIDPANPTVNYWYGKFFSSEGRSEAARLSFTAAADKFGRVEAYWVYTPTLTRINQEIYSSIPI